MVFLPCAVALIGDRERREESVSAYTDRHVDRVAPPRVEQATVPVTDSTKPARIAAAWPAAKTVSDPWGDLRDPLATGRGPRPLQGRLERAGIAALQARAIAARAQADALAAIAHAADAKAEAAAAHAFALERDATQAIHDMRRAA